jgi:hypothetical protein
MNSTDPLVHSFIVKVWVEERAGLRRKGWHGHVTHVPGGERRYLRDLDDIADFVAPYLEGADARVGLCRRLRLWLAR